MEFKKIKKAVACLMSVTLFATTLATTACTIDPPVDGNLDFYEEVDTKKTQLYIGNYNGGMGWEWLQKAKERFEAENANESFEQGKTGVQIMIDNGKDEYAASALMVNMKSNRQDIYVLDDTSYPSFVANGMLMDITDIVTEGGENSIENKMNASFREYYKTADNKYYALPFYEAFYHLTYDVDLFDTYLLWLNEDGTDFVTSLDEPRYPGLKGEEGT